MPVKFEAKASRRLVSVGEPFQVTVRLVTGRVRIRRLRLPRHRAFVVRDRQEKRTSRIQHSSGGRKRVQIIRRYLLVLEAKRAGSFVFSAGRVRVRRRTYRTRPFVVEVQKRSVPARRMASSLLPSRRLRPRGKLFVVASARPRQVYVGQQVTAIFYLFKRRKVNKIVHHRLPQLAGFEVENRPPSMMSWRVHHLRGKEYQYAVVGRYLLFPHRAGTLTLDPLSLRVTVGYSFVSRGREVIRASRPVPIKVLPLPQKGRPAGFNETNVGRYTLHLRLHGTRFRVGQPFTLQLSIQGMGNLKNMSLSFWRDVPHFRVYPPTSSLRRVTGTLQVRGVRTLEYLVLPQRAGKHQLPAQSFTFFDPWRKEYRTLHTKPLSLTVEPASGGKLSAAARARSQGALRSIHSATSLKRHPPPATQWGGWPLWLLLAPWLLVLLWGALDRWWQARYGLWSDVDRCWREALRQLCRWQEEALPDALLLAEVDALLHRCLEVRLGRPTRGLSRPRLRKELLQAGLSPESCETLCQLLESHELARFAPVLTVPAGQEIEQVRQWLENTQRPR